MAEGPSTHDPIDVTQVQPSGVAGLADLTLCDRYHLERLIGSGGMAQVWEATDLVLGRRVAVKVLHPHLAGDEAFVSRFRQEAVAAAKLSNPGIVGVYDTCSDGAHEAIVMELLDAVTLRQHLDENGPLDADTTVRIALRLLDALEAAHRAGLVHRDVKPSNILLCRDGRVKIADFGIAKADDQTELTQEGSLIGTASYLAPEQLLGGSVDGRTDLYSLGIVLYECLTGRVPFQGDSGAAVALARLHSDPLDPRRVRADVPPRVAATVMRVLSRDAAERFDSAADLRAALLDTGVAARTAPVEVVPEVEVVEQLEPESFARSERSWLVPTLFILLIATAMVVAGLLVRDTTLGDAGAPDPTAAPTTLGGPELVTIARAVPFDPQGDDVENDSIVDRAIDGDVTTSWRTESYDNPDFFGTKTGVGLALLLDAPTELTDLRLTGSENGWSASVFVLGDAEAPGGSLEGVDPDALDPVATITDARGPAQVDLGDPAPTGSVVLVWFTELGDPMSNNRHRVEISTATLEGRSSGP